MEPSASGGPVPPLFYSAKLQKISESTKHFRHIFSRKIEVYLSVKSVSSVVNK